MSLLQISHEILSSIRLSRLNLYIDETIGVISEDLDVINQLLLRYSAFERQWRKWECNGIGRQSFVDFKKAYDSCRREVLYSILTEFVTAMKLVRTISMCEVSIGKHLSDAFPIQSGLKQGDAL
jgi:hypothetical protein